MKQRVVSAAVAAVMTLGMGGGAAGSTAVPVNTSPRENRLWETIQTNTLDLVASGSALKIRNRVGAAGGLCSVAGHSEETADTVRWRDLPRYVQWERPNDREQNGGGDRQGLFAIFRADPDATTPMPPEGRNAKRQVSETGMRPDQRAH